MVNSDVIVSCLVNVLSFLSPYRPPPSASYLSALIFTGIVIQLNPHAGKTCHVGIGCKHCWDMSRVALAHKPVKLIISGAYQLINQCSSCLKNKDNATFRHLTLQLVSCQFWPVNDVTHILMTFQVFQVQFSLFLDFFSSFLVVRSKCILNTSFYII